MDWGREAYIQPKWLDSWSEKVKGPNGKCLCKFCRKEVPPGRRRYWCSQECIDVLNRESGTPRQLAYRRDKGICAHCGLDCEELKRVQAYVDYRAKKDRYLYKDDRYTLHKPRKRARPKWQKAFWQKYAWATRHLWEADHEKPVIEGGGGLGMENIRTLCVPCHRVQTKNLHKRLSDKRTGRRRLPGMEIPL